MTATDRPALARALARQPRYPLAAVPTPLQEARRLRDALGGPARCPRIFVKRDDLTGLAGGGNKARKLEFLVGDAQRAGATTLITTGAVQSNHARMTAGAARIAGMEAELVLTAHHDAPDDEGNLLLDRLFGARVHFVPSIDPMLAVGSDEETVRDVAAAVRARGGRPYVIPVGGSSAIGALGYVASDVGAVQRARRPGRGTDPALLRERLARHPGRTHPGRPPVRGTLHIARNCRQRRRAGEGASARAGWPARRRRCSAPTTRCCRAPSSPTRACIGEGYGLPTPDGLDAMLLLARTEALVLDPTYTAKAMAAFIGHIREGQIAPDEAVVFLHTGGSPAIFARAASDALRHAPRWQVL